MIACGTIDVIDLHELVLILGALVSLPARASTRLVEVRMGAKRRR
jgi:hypothetical protein